MAWSIKNMDRLRFAIPESVVSHMIYRYHNEMAHCGLEKTYQGLQPCKDRRKPTGFRLCENVFVNTSTTVSYV
jgi:hypothetical protein